jgi:glutathione S-transferase
MDLYYFPTSHWSRTISLVIEEKSLSPERHILDLRINGQYEPWYIAINPKAVVPTIVHDGRVVTNSLRIAKYLDEVAGPDLHLGGDVHVQEWVERLEAFELMHLSYRVWTLGKNGENSAAILADKVARAASYSEKYPEHAALYRRKHAYFERFVAALADPVVVAETETHCLAELNEIARVVADNDWIGGDQYSFADSIATSILYRLIDLHLLDRWNVDGHPLHAYFERLKARPSFLAVWTDDPYIAEVNTGRPTRKPLT